MAYQKCLQQYAAYISHPRQMIGLFLKTNHCHVLIKLLTGQLISQYAISAADTASSRNIL